MSTETANLAQIQDEDVLRKMWADADDFGRKKEIRTHMYKLREERLKEFYRSAESNETKTTSTSASTKATSQKTTQQDSMHADALVDQSFASFKSKEVRDSESPTRDIQYKLPETNEWQTSIREETSPDGRTKIVEATAGVEGTQKIDGGRVDFAAKTARISSSYQDSNTKSSKNVYAASESAVTRSEPQEKVVTETETLPDGTVVTTTRYSASAGASSKSTSSTKVVQSSTTKYEEDASQYGRAIEEQTKRSRDLVEENEGNKMSHIIRTSTEDRDIAGARKTTTSEFPAQIVEETRFRTKSPLKEDSKYTKRSAISEFSTQKNEEIHTKTSSHHQKEESSTRKSTINEFPVQNKEETYIITKSPQKYDSKCTKQTEFSTQKNQEILYHQKDDTTTKKTATSEFPAQKKEETPARSKSPQKEDSKYIKHTAVSEFSTQKNEEIQSKTTTHHQKEDASTKKTTTSEFPAQKKEETPTRSKSPQKEDSKYTKHTAVSEFPAQKKEETPTRAKSPQKEDSKYTKHTTISEFPAQKKEETPTRTRSPQKADTTYRSDYTSRKISVEMSAAHDKFARSLRTVSPDRVARKPSSSSPERSRHFSRFTSNETITICGADEDEEAAKSKRKITDRSPSSPLEERRPSEVRRSGSFRSPSPTKRVLKRTDTYEERCREILGIVGQSDRRSSLERSGKRGSFRKQRDDAGSPTKNQGGSKETAFVADKTKEITEFPSQRRFSSKENVTTATVEYVDDVKTVSKDDKSRKITEFPSQKRASSENVTEVSSRTRFSNEDNVNRGDTEDRNDVQRQEITEFPSQKRFSSKETITTEDSTTRDVQRQKITKFPSQRKEENVTTTTVEIVDDIKGVAKDDKSRKITEFPSQKRFSSKETITTEDSMTTKDVQKQKITKFPSQRKEESETTTTVEIVEDFKGIAKDDKSRKITEFPSQKRFSSKETITKEDVTTTKDVQKQKITEIPSQKRISSKEILTTTTVEFVDDVKSAKKDDKSRKITEFPSQKRLPSKEILTTTTSDLISQEAETVRDVQKQKIKEFPSQKRYSPKENVTIESTGGVQQQKVTEFSQQKRFSSKENVITTEDKSKTGRRITEFPSQKRFPSKETTTNTEEAIKKTKKEPTPSKLSELPSQKPKNTKPKIDKPATKRPDLTEFPAQKRPQSKESPKPQTNETTTNRTRIEEPKKPKKPDTNNKFIKAEKGQPTDPKPTKKPTTTSEEFIKREQQSTPAEQPQHTAKFEPIDYSGRTPVEEPVCIKRTINTTCPEDEHHKHRKSTKPDHIVVDLKRSKSSREPTPNGVYPVPSSSPENQLPRLPDEILEPDDVATKPAKLSEVPLVEQDDFDQITEIVDHQVITKRDRVDNTDESLFSLNKKIDLFSRTHQKPAQKDVGVPQRVDKLGVEVPDRPKSPRCRFNEDLEKPVSLENLYETTPKKTILSPAGRLRSTESIKKARELFENMAKEGTADVRATRRSSCTNERERSRSNSPKKDGETPGKDGTPHYMLPLEKHKHTPNEPAFHPRFHHEAVKDNETPHYMLPLDKHDKHTPITDLDSCAQHHQETIKDNEIPHYMLPLEKHQHPNGPESLPQDHHETIKDNETPHYMLPLEKHQHPNGPESRPQHHHETIKDNETPHYMLPIEKHKHTTSGSNSRLHHHHETIKDNETPHYMLPLEKHKHTPNEPAFHPRFHHEAVKDNETPHYMLPLDKHHEHTPITDLDCCPHAHHETIKDNETPHYMLPMEKHRHTPNEPAFHPRFHHEAAKDNETPHYMLPLEKHKHTSSGSNTRLEHHHETIKDNETPHYMLPLEKHHKHTPDNATAHQHTPRKDSEANKENETPHYMLPLDKRNKPHYMQPLDRSAHSQSESKSNKFGVTLRKTAPKSANLASTDVRISLQNRFGNLETLSQEVIEEIYEIEVLEQLLQIVYNYEVRRVIRTQIRLVRKLTSENRLEIYVEEKKRSRSIESEEKTNKTATYARKSSPERTPSPAKSDSSARSAFVAKKTKEIEAKRTKDSPRNADKDERIAIRTSEKQEYRKTTCQVGTDSITSSYGVGPTDKNGAPLFGLKALRSQREDNTTTKVQGTFVSGEYYSENGQEPVGQITVTEYSNDPKDLGSDAPSTGKDFITSVTTTQKFGYDDAPSLKSLGKQQSGRKPYGRVENTDGTLTKERRNSVKAISQKFIDSTVESLKSERQPAYPKAGLILRTSSFKDSKLDATKSDNSTDVVTSTKTSTSSGSFLTNRTAVSGVQDVISRMKTDEHRSGDSIEDAEARNLLNRFLGSQVLLTGMESMNTNVKTSPTGVVTRKTVKITKSTKDGDKTETKSFVFQGPITEEELENIWDQKTLRLLLEQSTDYEERRIIRNRLRRVMAEQEACAELVQQASGERPTTARADTTEGESLLLPLLQDFLQDEERDADRRAGLVADVRAALDRLSASLRRDDEPDMPADKRRSLLRLVDKLQAGLSAAVPARPPDPDRSKPTTPPHEDDARRLIEEMSRCKFDAHAHTSPSIEPVRAPRLSLNPIYAKPAESQRFNSQMKKMKMKRANTIDIPKPSMQQLYNEPDYSDDERSRDRYYNSARAPGDPVAVPEFRPKTASDRKFLAFLNKNAAGSDRETRARSSIWTEQNDRASIWGSRFGNIKNKFEIEPMKASGFEEGGALTGKLTIKRDGPMQMPVNQFKHAPQSAFKPIAPSSRRVEAADGAASELVKTEIRDVEADKSLFLYSPKPLEGGSSKPWLTPESGGGRVLSMAAKKFEPQRSHRDAQPTVKPRKLSREFTEQFDRQPEYTSRTTVVYQLPHNRQTVGYQPPVIKQQVPPTIKRQPTEATPSFKQFTTPTVRQPQTQLTSPTVKQSAPTFRQSTQLISPPIEQQPTQLSPTFKPQLHPTLRQPTTQLISPTVEQQLSPTFVQATHLTSPPIGAQSTQLSPTFRQPTSPGIKQQQPQSTPTIKPQLAPTFRQPTTQLIPTVEQQSSPTFVQSTHLTSPPIGPQLSPTFRQPTSPGIKQQQQPQSTPTIKPQLSPTIGQHPIQSTSPIIQYNASPQPRQYPPDVNQQPSLAIAQQPPPPAGPPPKFETQLSNDSVHEYTAISSKVMGGAQQAVTVKQGPKTRDEHDAAAAATLKHALTFNFPAKLSSRSFGSKDAGDSSRLGVVKPMQKAEYDGFRVPKVNVEPGSPLAKSESWHRFGERPGAVVKSKSSHSLAVPQRQFEAGMSKDELAQKRKAMEAYLSSGRTAVRTSINRIRTIDKRSACGGNVDKSSGIARSRTLPDIVCPMLDESNVDQAFEDLFKSTCA